ncbi:hypothetical protein AVEN_53146-1 [Araneus ventricosus]|uniref:Uncharacterized protein n=1 Tax=Araneus ventricosus TaxID=182803 RepID=A0A4Y2UW73_ARAVE|nr:hypothetical protein AVEN_53146-1 [Araneus ventricosus]
MARAIYSLKLSLFSSQLKLNTKEALLDVYLFIEIICVKSWLQWILAVNAPYKDLCFLKSLKAYEKVNESISKAASQKFSQNLWYFTDEIEVLVLFDDDVDEETKLKMGANLHKKIFSTHEKRYIPSKEELCGSLYGNPPLRRTESAAEGGSRRKCQNDYHAAEGTSMVPGNQISCNILKVLSPCRNCQSPSKNFLKRSHEQFKGTGNVYHRKGAEQPSVSDEAVEHVRKAFTPLLNCSYQLT